MRIWEQRPDTGDGWWASAGRMSHYAARPWFGVDGKTLVISPFGLFGVSVCWALGVYVSIGASFVGHVGVGYIRRYK